MKREEFGASERDEQGQFGVPGGAQNVRAAGRQTGSTK
jgi:hypothetical protein